MSSLSPPTDPSPSPSPNPNYTCDAMGQTLAVKRAEVELHRFASLGEPEAAEQMYAAENVRREAFLRAHADYCGPISPFLELGANAGHTSYLLTNSFGAEGYALDICEDSLRFGRHLGSVWGMKNEPIRITGDAEKLPFQDGSLAMVCAFQMLSQFQNLEGLFAEVWRVLRPGGVFIFAEEPVRRRLSLRLFRCSYEASMKPWEKWLLRQGLLGYLVQDVIGAEQEESIGIRQNHRRHLGDWKRLIAKFFPESRTQLFLPDNGWGDRLPQRIFSETVSGELLGGTIGAICRKQGTANAIPDARVDMTAQLCCPDCATAFGPSSPNSSQQALLCPSCGFAATPKDGVYPLLSSQFQALLYPGDRPDIADFSRPLHDGLLYGDWHEVEGEFGNKYRWMGESAGLNLRRVEPGPHRLRLRGFVHELALAQHGAVTFRVLVNGALAGVTKLKRPGLFFVQHDLPAGDEYNIQLTASPVWTIPADGRHFTVNISLVRLVPLEDAALAGH